LSLSAVWQHINTFDTTTLAGTPLATLQPGVGAVGLFDDEVNLSAVYSFGPLTVSWSGQWMSAATGVDLPGDIFANTTVGPFEIEDQWFHDLSGTYDIMDNISIYGGVRNVANNHVFIGPSAFAATPTGWATDPDTYDGLGRRYFFGVRVKM
jgi:outer membrane receptor protein involved in Fe transport